MKRRFCITRITSATIKIGSLPIYMLMMASQEPILKSVKGSMK